MWVREGGNPKLDSPWTSPKPTLLCNYCLGRTKGDKHGLTWPSKNRGRWHSRSPRWWPTEFHYAGMLTKNILNKGGEESWRVDVVRLVVTRRTDDKWGDASRGTSPTHTLQFFNEIFSHELRKRRTEWWLSWWFTTMNYGTAQWEVAG